MSEAARSLNESAQTTRIVRAIEKHADRIVEAIEKLRVANPEPWPIAHNVEELLDIPGNNPAAPDNNVIDLVNREAEADVYISPGEKLAAVVRAFRDLQFEDDDIVLFKVGTNNINVDMTIEEIRALSTFVRNHES